MYRTSLVATLAALLVSLSFGQSLSKRGSAFDGKAALALTAKAVAFGPRPDGSPEIAKLRVWIKDQLRATGAEVSVDSFTAQTPEGPLPMENIIARFRGKSGKTLVISGHYDTKKMAGFVGANDGGSSTGFLLELAQVLRGVARADDIDVVFFDGEEAVREWSDTDSVYGSRHLAEKWTADGSIRKIKALINVDMIGDRNFRLTWETDSAPSLRNTVWNVADSLGYASAFPRQGGPVSDDHIPFIHAGVRALDLIDFESQSSFWHTPQDTMDKLSAQSFDILGHVVLKSIEVLQAQN